MMKNTFNFEIWRPRPTFSIVRHLILFLIAIALIFGSTLEASSRVKRKSVVNMVKGISADYSSNRIFVHINDLMNDKDPGILVDDNLSYKISSNEARYYFLVLVDPIGIVSAVFPDRSISDYPVKYKIFEYPPVGTGSLTQAKPVGIESVFVFASDEAIIPADFGFPSDYDIHQIGDDTESVKQFVGEVNRKLAGASTDGIVYEYFVDSDVQFNTRAVRRELKKRIKQVNVLADAKKTQNPDAGSNSVEGGSTVRTSELLSDALAVNDIRFEVNSDSLSPVGRTQLDIFGSELLNIWSQNSNFIVALEGHTDDSGELDYNQLLSERRASAAKQYLVKEFGLPSDGIYARGLGETKPMTANSDSHSRSLNRRVEIRIGRKIVSEQ